MLYEEQEGLWKGYKKVRLSMFDVVFSFAARNGTGGMASSAAQGTATHVHNHEINLTDLQCN
jgi:hypothetical protein